MSSALALEYTHSAILFPLLNKAVYSPCRASVQIRDLYGAHLCNGTLWSLPEGMFYNCWPWCYVLSLGSQEQERFLRFVLWCQWCRQYTQIGVIPWSSRTTVSGLEFWPELALMPFICPWLPGRHVHKSTVWPSQLGKLATCGLQTLWFLPRKQHSQSVLWACTTPSAL